MSVNYEGGAHAPFAVLDLETTGVNPHQCEVIQAAVILADSCGEPVDEWVTLVRPQGPVAATHIHGLTDADVAGAPTFAELIPTLVEVLAGRVLVAHNARYDLAVLGQEFARAGWVLPELSPVCTLEASRTYLPSLGRWRLADCCAACGIPLDEQHDALADARATAAVLGAFLTRSPDRGDWLEWSDAAVRSAAVEWPTGPTIEPVKLSRAPEWVSRAQQVHDQPPLLVETAASLDLHDVLDEGAPAAALTYLEMLAGALEDGVLTMNETRALDHLAGVQGLDPAQVVSAHVAFMRALAHAAFEDGKVTRHERDQMYSVAHLLGLPDDVVNPALDRAESNRKRSMSQDLPPLPPDWTLGEPLRVGDKVVFTGCVAHGRDQLEQRAEDLGVRVVGSVSRRTRFLVTDETMNGTKSAKAEALDVARIHPLDFTVMLDHLQPALEPGDRPAGHTNGPTAPAVSPAVIRAWARDQGYEVGDRGRLHLDLIDAYHAANPDVAAHAQLGRWRQRVPGT